jgi:hypothetical protein
MSDFEISDFGRRLFFGALGYREDAFERLRVRTPHVAGNDNVRRG